MEKSPSVFTRLEATRAELESQFGFNRFLEIYTQIQVLCTITRILYVLYIETKYCNHSVISILIVILLHVYTYYNNRSEVLQSFHSLFVPFHVHYDK